MSAPFRTSRLPDLRGLSRTLDAQDRALHKRDLAGLPELVTRLSALCDRMEAQDAPLTPAEASITQDLRRHADRSLRRVGAVLAGLRDAQALLEAARNTPADATYGPRGQRLPLAPSSGRLERRT